MMRNQIIRLVCIFLLGLHYVASQNTNKAAAPCIAPNGAHGYCLLYTECANLTHWRLQHNIQEAGDVHKMMCGKDQLHVCCNRTHPYYTGTDYFSQLHSKGLALLQSMPCATQYVGNHFVANGVVAELGKFPFMALLRYNSRDQYRCGGSLITNRFVLTAAHCILEDLIGVRLGEHDLTTEIDCAGSPLCLPPTEDFFIEQKIIHPSYNKSRWAHDVALLKLEREVVFKVHIKPICLPITTFVHEHEILRKSYTVAGWGRTENGNSSNILKSASVPHQERNVCQRVFLKYGIAITYDHICAGGGGEHTDTCKGDSGGPLLTTVPFTETEEGAIIDRMVQYGIASFGLSFCGDERTNVSVYANVFQYMPWITKIIANCGNCEFSYNLNGKC